MSTAKHRLLPRTSSHPLYRCLPQRALGFQSAAALLDQRCRSNVVLKRPEVCLWCFFKSLCQFPKQWRQNAARPRALARLHAVCVRADVFFCAVVSQHDAGMCRGHVKARPLYFITTCALITKPAPTYTYCVILTHYFFPTSPYLKRNAGSWY